MNKDTLCKIQKETNKFSDILELMNKFFKATKSLCGLSEILNNNFIVNIIGATSDSFDLAHFLCEIISIQKY